MFLDAVVVFLGVYSVFFFWCFLVILNVLGCSVCFGGVLGCFWLFMVVFGEVEMVFQGSFKDVSRKFESVSTKFQGCFKKV